MEAGKGMHPHPFANTPYIKSSEKKLARMKVVLTFCWQLEAPLAQTRHLESNTNTVNWLLNVTLLLDTDTNHVILAQ